MSAASHLVTPWLTPIYKLIQLCDGGVPLILEKPLHRVLVHGTPTLFLCRLQVTQDLLYAVIIQELSLIRLKQMRGRLLILFFFVTLVLTQGLLKLSKKDQLEFLPRIEGVLRRQPVLLLEGKGDAGVFGCRCEKTLVDVLAHFLQMVHWLF